jgi:hypothetical protein
MKLVKGKTVVVEVQLHVFLTAALAGGEWYGSRHGHFTHGKEASAPTAKDQKMSPLKTQQQSSSLCV